MEKNKISYYASMVVLICGLMIIGLQLFAGQSLNSKTIFGFVFLLLGFLGVRYFRTKI